MVDPGGPPSLSGCICCLRQGEICLCLDEHGAKPTMLVRADRMNLMQADPNDG